MTGPQKQQWAGMAVAAVLGSSSGVGGSVIYMENIGPAEHVTELREMRRTLEYHLRNHPDVINQFDRRLTRLETKLDILLQKSKQSEN